MTPQKPLVWLAIAFLGGIGIIAAEPAAADDRGFFLGISPLTGAFSVAMEYDRPGTGETIRADESLVAWSLEAGWRFSSGLAVGLARTASRGTVDSRGPEYAHLLLRADWRPTRSSWWLSLGSGVAVVKGRMAADPLGTLFPRSGSGAVITVGAGGDLPVSRSLALRGRVEWLRERALHFDTTDSIDADGWSLGAAIVWLP